MNTVGTIVRTKSGACNGKVTAIDGPWWQVEWEDGKTTWSDGRLLTAEGHVVQWADTSAMRQEDERG